MVKYYVWRNKRIIRRGGFVPRTGTPVHAHMLMQKKTKGYAAARERADGSCGVGKPFSPPTDSSERTGLTYDPGARNV